MKTKDPKNHLKAKFAQPFGHEFQAERYLYTARMYSPRGALSTTHLLNIQRQQTVKCMLYSHVSGLRGLKP